MTKHNDKCNLQNTMKEERCSAILFIIQITLAGFAGCAGPLDPEADLSSLPGRIYFNSNRTGNLEIYSCKPDGTGIRNLTRSTDTDGWFPAVSPDAARVAFMRGSMRIMDAEGSNYLQVSYSIFSDSYPAWR